MIRGRALVNIQKKLNFNIQPIRMMSGVPETFTEKQEKLGRPCSPDVKIYKFSATALSSISNRITGCVLSGGIYLTK